MRNGALSLAGGLLAGLLIAAAVQAEGAALDAATSEQSQKAQELFLEADRLFDVQQYEQAIEKYRASHAVVESPNSRLMVARCLRELGRLDEAHAEYEGALAAAEVAAKKKPQYRQTVQSAREELQALRTRVGLVRIDLGNVPPESQLRVAGREVATDALGDPVVVVPGRVAVEAEAPDGQRARVEVIAAAGRETAVHLELGVGATDGDSLPAAAKPPPAPVSDAPPLSAASPAEEDAPAYRTLAYVSGGVGAVGLVAFAVFGTMTSSTFSDLESSCPDGHCSPDRSDDIDRGRLYQNLANAGAVVGVLGLGASATLFYLGSGEREARVAIGPASLQIRGRF